MKALEREIAAQRRGEKTRFTELLPSDDSSSESGSSDNEDDNSSSNNSSSTSGSSKEEADDSKFDGKIPDGVDPKEWKRQVKAATREKRQNKMKKHVKKQKIKKRSTRR